MWDKVRKRIVDACDVMDMVMAAVLFGLFRKHLLTDYNYHRSHATSGILHDWTTDLRFSASGL